jgi:hypothetical protein
MVRSRLLSGFSSLGYIPYTLDDCLVVVLTARRQGFPMPLLLTCCLLALFRSGFDNSLGCVGRGECGSLNWLARMVRIVWLGFFV